MISKIFFKITNELENHFGFQYVNGLNIYEKKFNDDSNNPYCKGGFYFTDVENIFKFLDYGIYLRKVSLPLNDTNLKLVKINDRWRSNMFFLNERYDLKDITTFPNVNQFECKYPCR